MLKYDKKKFIDMFEKGVSLKEIGKEFKLSYSGVYRRLTRMGIKLKKIEHESLVGKKFGKLLIIKFIKKDKYRSTGKYYYEYKCLCDCGKEIICKNHLISAGKQSCFKCGRDSARIKLKKHIIPSKMWNGILNRCKRKKEPLLITKDDIYDMYIKQNGKCLLTGINIGFNHYNKDECTASVDRIDSSKGYILSNIRLVHKTTNIMKWSMSDSEFVKWCRLIVQHHEEKGLDRNPF